ncbi:hypothetical protein C7H19_15830 [Aphanothece hegewaldii CCALA 016]|uniref:Uncharacterized protein n=1 Tax=Aphanothece hegewaldii CCALA 016 TaxID=2107694 RepID=A0A2T1LVF8_9CHRO|nr:hypothetical protein [Aphanothece hegewaldii]PSF35705.1 hypothetical protein C7H19_15830 [Aphanothece hegewaldii CCALA 016]
MQLSANVFDEVVQYLDTHEETLRIKKLIFCLCKKYWENDPNIVNRVSTEELLQELIDLRPSSDQLTFSVYKLVKTLNRPKVYAVVAKVIIDEVGKLYNTPSPSIHKTEFVPSEFDTNPNTELEIEQELSEEQIILEKITNYLANHQEVERLKKLIFATTKNKWENNSAIIDSYGLKNLIWELRQSNTTKNKLKESLYRIAENINKKTLYVAIADLIIRQMDSLYVQVNLANGHQKTVNIDEAQVYDTQIIHVKQELNPSQKSVETSIIDFQDLKTEVNIVLPVTPPVTVTASKSRDYDPFELRLDIMQYTNPLRAKIILYSVLFHPWDQSGQDWSTLGSMTLDDLLEQLIQKDRTLKEIESRLYAAAKMLNDPDTNVQTAGIIVQALQRIL